MPLGPGGELGEGALQAWWGDLARPGPSPVPDNRPEDRLSRDRIRLGAAGHRVAAQHGAGGYSGCVGLRRQDDEAPAASAWGCRLTAGEPLRGLNP